MLCTCPPGFNSGNLHNLVKWSDINDNNFIYELPPPTTYTWQRMIFETQTILESGEEQGECAARCAIIFGNCDFFAISSGKCYFGRYSHWGDSFSLSSITSYHKSNFINKGSEHQSDTKSVTFNVSLLYLLGNCFSFLDF